MEITGTDFHLPTELAKVKGNLTDAELDTKIAELTAAVRIALAHRLVLIVHYILP